MAGNVPRTAPPVTVNDAGNPEAFVATRQCKHVSIRENPQASGYPRQFGVRTTLSDDTHWYDGMATHVFTCPGGPDRLWAIGETVGYAETASGTGSTTFLPYEY